MLKEIIENERFSDFYLVEVNSVKECNKILYILGEYYTEISFRDLPGGCDVMKKLGTPYYMLVDFKAKKVSAFSEKEAEKYQKKPMYIQLKAKDFIETF